MSGRKKALWVAVGCLALIVLGWGAIFAAVWATGGLVTVNVEEREGTRIYLPVPAGLLTAAVHFGGPWIHEAGSDSVEWRQWAPLAEELLRNLDEIPDATLVEVEDGHDRVLIRKRGSMLEIEVDEPDARVRVSVPTRLLRWTAGKLLA